MVRLLLTRVRGPAGFADPEVSFLVVLLYEHQSADAPGVKEFAVGALSNVGLDGQGDRLQVTRRTIRPTLIERVAADHPTVRKTWVHAGYRQHLVEQPSAGS